MDYFQQLGKECHVVRNDIPLNEITKLNYSGVVLSPGPETPAKAGCLMEVIDFYHKKTPMLGICLGHQAIGEFFGARLCKAARPMHGKLSKIETNQKGAFHGLPKIFEVVRYHSLVLDQLPKALKISAQTEADEVMALQHGSLPLEGLQFHPEAVLTEHGLQMLKNWLRFNNIHD